ncbi:hypothetical protein [Corynebacterium mayonis]|uniref:hypothetical protein n=1 Tax=Corynebacterium mayonis TaxID=3062461 RepID=UPI0031404535
MKSWVVALGAGLLLVSASPAVAVDVDSAFSDERTAIAVYHPDKRWSGSPGALEARPALSLAKLYLAYYVLYNGTDEEKGLVKEMIALSDDAIATRLDNAYPEAIGTIAEDFNLPETHRNGSWGLSTTAAYDVAKFLASILWDPKAKPLLDAMKNAPDIAQDGFPQKFGTAKLDGATGFKTGWANEKDSATASVAYGQSGDEVWVAAALTNGDAYDNTADAARGINQGETLRLERSWKFKAWRWGQPIPFTAGWPQ